MLNTQNSTSKDIWKKRVLYNFFSVNRLKRANVQEKLARLLASVIYT